VQREFFHFRCDSHVVRWQMVLAGYGIGFTHSDMGDAKPKVVRLLPEAPLPQLPIWLTAHAELRTSRRIRRVFDFLAAELAAKFFR
jgi:DNA-binding transcriptional LysR family regulator